MNTAGPPRSADLRLALLLGALLVLWTAVPALVQTAPHGDNVEQFNWAHVLAWGYVKHPPLSTWLLHAALTVMPPGDVLSYAMGMACVGACLALVYACARTLGPAIGAGTGFAATVVLVTSADYYLMGRGSFYNHNTVMLPFVAASAWAVLRIVRGGAGASVWLVLGLAQALGMLTKYQMAVVILANALALFAAGCHRRPGFVRGAALAALATLLPLVPHALWLPQHGYSSFEYAGHSLLAALPWFDRLRQCVGFLAQQLGRLAPALVVLVVIALRVRQSRRAALPPPEQARGHAERTVAAPAQGDGPGGSAPDTGVAVNLQQALAMLALVPVLCVVALTLALGVAPQNHWGSTTTVLLPLLVLARWPAAQCLGLRIPVIATVAVHLVSAGWVLAYARIHPEAHNRFAAAELAAQAQSFWRDGTGMPEPAILVGPDWEAGALALHMKGYPMVVAGGRPEQAPWVDEARINDCGALLLWRPEQAKEAQIAPAWLERAGLAPGGTQAPIPASRLARISIRDARGQESSLDLAILTPRTAGPCTIPGP